MTSPALSVSSKALSPSASNFLPGQLHAPHCHPAPCLKSECFWLSSPFMSSRAGELPHHDHTSLYKKNHFSLSTPPHCPFAQHTASALSRSLLSTNFSTNFRFTHGTAYQYQYALNTFTMPSALRVSVCKLAACGRQRKMATSSLAHEAEQCSSTVHDSNHHKMVCRKS